MSKNLNDAFIRAYSKDRAAHGPKPGDAAVSEDDNPLIVRVDTATVIIPPPHILNASTRPRVAAHASGSPALAKPVTRSATVAPSTNTLRRPIRVTDMVQEENRTPSAAGGMPEPDAAHFLGQGRWQEHFDVLGVFPTYTDQNISFKKESSLTSRPMEGSTASQHRSGEPALVPNDTKTSVEPAEIFQAAANALLDDGKSLPGNEPAHQASSSLAESYAPVLPTAPAHTTAKPQTEVLKEVFKPSKPVPSEEPSEHSKADASQQTGEKSRQTTNSAESQPKQFQDVVSTSSSPQLGIGGEESSVEVQQIEASDASEPPALRSDRKLQPAATSSERSARQTDAQQKVAPALTEEDATTVTERRAATIKPTARELEKPIAPALTFEEVSRAMTNLAAERKEYGEIFRLDRPSYSSEASHQEVESGKDQTVDERTARDSVARDSVAGDSAASALVAGDLTGEEIVDSQIEGRESSSDASDSTESQSSLHAADNHARNDATRAAEEGLRKARLKIFNPVWEVDALQWPAVCSELLKRRSENLERVAQNLISACQEGLQVLAVTSPSGGEGRTTVACCLAMLAGSHGLNVAILDGDIENPTLSLQTNLDIEQDWKTAMLNQMSLEEVAVHSLDDQVTLLPLLNPIHRDELASDDNRIAFMLHELSESFDLVIVDMGHMDSTRSLVTSMGEQGMINAVVTVVDLRNFSPGRLDACLRRIRRTGISSIGLVENFAA